MRLRKTWVLGAALCAALLCGAESRAGTINFLATGVFSSSSTPTFTNGGTTVDYTALASTATVPPTNNVSLGTFTTASTSVSPDSTIDTFTLTVTNTDTLDFVTFSGTMSGAISGTTSSASIVFSSPLTQSLDGFLVSIVSADNGTPGRVNLNAPSTNGGVSSISATISVVPEPTSAALLGLAVPVLAGLVYRRARR